MCGLTVFDYPRSLPPAPKSKPIAPEYPIAPPRQMPSAAQGSAAMRLRTLDGYLTIPRRVLRALMAKSNGMLLLAQVTHITQVTQRYIARAKNT